MISRVYCASTIGVDARLIEVEINMSGGVPKYFLVGLPDRAVSESKDRIFAAILNAGKSFPRGKITVNLAPADLPKEGSAFDLPIALNLLAVSHQIKRDKLMKSLVLGELALDGKLRPVKGVLPMAIEAKRNGLEYVILPEDNGPEAAVVKGISVMAFGNIQDVIEWLEDKCTPSPIQIDLKSLFQYDGRSDVVDFDDVKGQENVKRALEVAAAGSHNVIMVGPPGSGKTMMARRLPTILPPLTLNEALETTKIHSVAGLVEPGKSIVTRRPFRSPHHTVSPVALVGGGSIPMPGEISMAHNGILFLDELPEFNRGALEVMRQPLEDGTVTISRSRMSVSYPSRIMLVASMNPSPTGDWYTMDDPEGATNIQMQRYLSKISGPLLDRIDLHIDVEKVGFRELSGRSNGECSADIRRRVIRAREIQSGRFIGVKSVYSNAQMNTKMVRRICIIDDAGKQMLKKAMNSLGLSARAYDRILKVSRTIADLDEREQIGSNHIAEAIQYRSLDREGWLG
ncbi:MAG: YifB family Mg chelatase-like AAA ATPase [Balneolaceae bacterium]